MAFEKLITEAERFSVSNEVSGEWSCIQLKINKFSPEYLNVGVVFAPDNGGAFCKMLDNFTSLDCLFDGNYNQEQIRDALGQVKAHFLLLRGLDQSSHLAENIRMTRPAFFSGDSVESVLEWLYDEVVTLARHKKSKKKSGFQSKRNDDAVKELISCIKQADPQSADSYINQHLLMQIEDDIGHVHRLNVPFATRAAVGSPANGWIKTWESIRANIFEAAKDAEVAAIHTKRAPSLFLLSPNSMAGIPAQDIRKIENNLDELLWKIKKGGCNIIQGFGVEHLAEQVVEW
ncbi:MAG: hypothetical protein ACSHWQ_01490, partial [Spongiibacteraceae bacterium]